MMRAVVFVVSVAAAAGLVCRGLAWMNYQEGEAYNNVSLVQQASRLDPFVSDYAYEEYLQTHDLSALERAIRLEPSKGAYHMYAGLVRIDRNPNDKDAVKEICIGAELKPYSSEYKSACEGLGGEVK